MLYSVCASTCTAVISKISSSMLGGCEICARCSTVSLKLRGLLDVDRVSETSSEVTVVLDPSINYHRRELETCSEAEENKRLQRTIT